MASIAGFVIGSALASELEDEDDRRRVGLVASLMPSPLIGAIVAQEFTRTERMGDPREDLRRICGVLEEVDNVTDAEGRKLLIEALKTELEQLEEEERRSS